ncbi:polysaccharide biosynthesis/export family protein [Paramagnetospirillum magneticum]|uniref:polysaccharide biosynthesis/export family protein n=1 Tax=Paramagnetospirillum magneticum TaxID=84159 RepID=UPI0003055D1C|nr:polysaccharide biosynthesis/export family protein [Paramagnetospirillum magneticum]
MRWLRIVAVLLVAGCSSVGWAADLAYVLGPNDKVKITVFGEPDLSGEFEIGGSGTLAMPLVGEIPLGGKNLSQASGLLAERLRQGILRDPKVSVEVLNYRPFFILGEVNQPGSYPYVNGMTVVNAAAIGGGFTYRADKKDIKITREGAQGKTEIKGQMESTVMPGDVIWVGERFF